MKLTEINEIIEGKYKEELKVPKKFVQITVEDFQQFMDLLSIDPTYHISLGITEDSTEYFNTFSFLKRAVDPEKQEDLFYAAKLGFFFEGVPVRLTYILNKAILKYNTPNNAISAIDERLWAKYSKKGSLPEGITIKKVMENLLGNSFETLQSFRRKVKWNDCYEIYVENENRVVIVPEDIGEQIDSRDDLENVHYVKDKGVCLYDEPLRIMGNRVGVTFNEFDLRECF